VTPLPELLHGRSRAGPVRQERPVYVDLLPPCNAGCPSGENIQAWLAHAETGDHERAWRQPGDPRISGREVEQRHIDILGRVKDAVTVPVAVKLSPHFSSPGEMAVRLDEAGADGLVLFNRFLQPDIDPETLAVMPDVYLSSPAEARLPRTWISILRRHLRASLAATTGVEGPADVIKYLLAGADVVMTASALIRHGPGHAAVLLDGLSGWMARKGYPSVAAVRGMLALPADTDQAAYERAGYVRAMQAANSSPGPW